MNVALLESKPFKAVEPIDAHDVTSRVIAEELGWDLVYTGHKLRADKPYAVTGGRPHYWQYMDKEYDAVILVHYTSYSDIEAMAEFVARNKRAKLYWLSNEYGNIPNYNFLMQDERPVTVIAIYEELPRKLRWKFGKKIDALHCVNLNSLVAKPSNPLREKEFDLIYYGAFRPGRVGYFKEYLKAGIHLSTSTKNFIKFGDFINFCDPELIDPDNSHTMPLFRCACCPIKTRKLRWKRGGESLNRFICSLYLQDEFSHDFPEHIAQRFYEAGNCNVVLLFDKHCRGFFEKHGLEIDDFYFVDSHKSMIERKNEIKKDFEIHLRYQKKWHEASLQKKERSLVRLREIVEENSIPV